MKDDIYNNYNLVVNELIKINDSQSCFIIDDKIYYYMNCNYNLDQIKQKMIIADFLKDRLGIDSLKIIFTKSNEVINNKNMILLSGNYLTTNRKIDIVDIEKYGVLKVYNNKVNDWSKKWVATIDNIEKKLSQTLIDDANILLIINYYVGLGENAIYLFHKYFSNGHNYTPSHSIIMDNYYSIVNPLNYLWDYEQRDYAEYIKFTIMNDTFNVKDVEYIMKIKKWNIDDVGIFYSRILFFDDFFKDLNVYLNTKNVDIKKYLQIANIFERSIKEISELLLKEYNVIFPFAND